MTHHSSDDSLDIQALGAKAQSALEKTRDKSQRKTSTVVAGQPLAFWLKLALIAGLAWFFFWQSAGLRRQFFGVPQATLQLEAQAVLTSARAAVEQHHKETGIWPDRVPQAALDALVSLERAGNGYQVTVELEGDTWTMDHNGNLKGGKK